MNPKEAEEHDAFLGRGTPNAIQGAAKETLDALYNDAHSFLRRTADDPGRRLQTEAVVSRVVEEWARQREEAFRTQQQQRERGPRWAAFISAAAAAASAVIAVIASRDSRSQAEVLRSEHGARLSALESAVKFLPTPTQSRQALDQSPTAISTPSPEPTPSSQPSPKQE
jgi:hypothetical protein